MLTSAKDIIKKLFPTGKVSPSPKPVGGCLPFLSYAGAEAWVAECAHYPVGVVVILNNKPVRAVWHSKHQVIFFRSLTQTEGM